MVINQILSNSEKWHGLKPAHLLTESIDEAIIGGILKPHRKTPKEFLYLETGAVPLKWIVAQRKILQRDDN